MYLSLRDRSWVGRGSNPVDVHHKRVENSVSLIYSYLKRDRDVRAMIFACTSYHRSLYRCGLKVEEDSDADGKSKSNDHEAELCVALCRYLVLQGYSTESITILVAYTGQIFAIKKIITKDQKFYSGVLHVGSL